jgi:hypothetical protein
MSTRGAITLRAAGPDDQPALRRLELLADRRLPTTPLLVAESDGELIAAVSCSSGEAVTDPFRATADLLALLRLRRNQLGLLAA